MDSKRGISKSPPIFDTTVAVQVQLFVTMPTQETAQETAEELSDIVESRIFTYVPLIDLVNAFRTANTQIYVDTAGAKPVAKIDMTLEIETREQFVQLEGFAVLQELAMAVDFAGGPVDPIGAYLAPPVGDVPTLAPRSPVDGGPDGRVEGLIRLDMTSGTPLRLLRPVVRGAQVLFPDGSSLDQYRGWNWGRFGTAKESDADLAKQQGARIIRLPLRWWGNNLDDLGQGLTSDSRDDLSPSTAGINPVHLAILDQTVAWCEARGIWFILFIDSNCGQSGTQTGEPEYCTMNAGGPLAWPNGRNFLTDPSQFAKYRKVWQFVARRYRNSPSLGIFEITPEVGWDTGTPDDIINYYRILSADIRQCAPGVPFIVGGESYKLPKVKTVYDARAIDYIYTGDAFIHSAATPDPVTDVQGRIDNLIDMRAKLNVPVFLQQLGCTTGEDLSDFTYTRGLLNYALANNIGGTYWELRDANNNSAGFGAIYSDFQGVDHVKPDYMAIIAQWIAGQAV